MLHRDYRHQPPPATTNTTPDRSTSDGVERFVEYITTLKVCCIRRRKGSNLNAGGRLVSWFSPRPYVTGVLHHSTALPSPLLLLLILYPPAAYAFCFLLLVHKVSPFRSAKSNFTYSFSRSPMITFAWNHLFGPFTPSTGAEQCTARFAIEACALRYCECSLQLVLIRHFSQQCRPFAATFFQSANIARHKKTCQRVQ